MRDTLYWPRMTTEVREYVSKCEICLAHRDSPGKEPIIPHEIIARPWSKVECESNGCTLLVMCDYYCNFIKVAHLMSTTSRCVIRKMSEVFACFGVVDILVTDNAPNFTSAEFAVFAKTWAFEHVTSSPHYSGTGNRRMRLKP